MTPTVTSLTDTVTSHSGLATSLQLSAMLLLTTLLIMRELVRVYEGDRSRDWIESLNTAIIPLLLALCVTLAIRVLR